MATKEADRGNSSAKYKINILETISSKTKTLLDRQ
jgi:hypothetical protein